MPDANFLKYNIRMKNHLQRLVFVAALFIITVLGGGCASPEKVVYFQDKSNSENVLSIKSRSLVYGPNDLLGITITTLDQEAVKPFTKSVQQQLRTNDKEEYLINSRGTIFFPGLGELKVQGLTRLEVVDLFKERLQPFLKDVIVDVQLLNFKFTVLGEVSKPGTHFVKGERLTVLEALGLAGESLPTGVRNNILVIRTNSDKITEHRIDLTDRNVIMSEAYYLQQNDVIYVQPNKGGVNASASKNNLLLRSNLGVISSVITSLVSLVVLFITLNR